MRAPQPREIVVGLGKRVFGAYWRWRNSDLPCPICGSATTEEIAYSRSFRRCQACQFCYCGDFPAAAARRGMGLDGSWRGSEGGGRREDVPVRLPASNGLRFVRVDGPDAYIGLFDAVIAHRPGVCGG